MKFREFELFTDQNVHADVIAFLRNEGFNVIDVNESGWAGEDDLVLFRRAAAMGRVIVTHDLDFGQIAFQHSDPFIGILQVRPGHLLPGLTIDTLQQLLANDPEVEPSFMLTATRKAQGVRIRVLLLPP